jgi:hypothetical protein
MPVTPRLTKLFGVILESALPGSEPTLSDVRAALLRESIWSEDGELLYAQDITSCVLDLDDVIDRYGIDACARHLVDQIPA